MLFEDLKEMPQKDYVEYQGTGINQDADPAREVNRRIINARVAQSKLNLFWREGKISRRWRILMYNAIVGTKLIYGLEALPITEVLKKKA